MGFEQLLGRYVRLRGDLALEYSAAEWNSGRIDRLVAELSETEQRLAALRPGGDWSLGLGGHPALAPAYGVGR